MKRILLLHLMCLLLPVVAFSQATSSLQVSEFVLSNGMKVWVNVDHSQPKVFGAVVVNAGAVDCPNTGIAHYFEHIMFKGTDELGTVDYAAERVYLDSISMKYDQLANTTDDKARKAIQQDINRLNVKAADYAIPNEFSRLTSLYGGTDLNAGTSYDFTFYHNTFSPQFIEQWCELNSHRLIHPVFRMFQGELETVYEEKNMYSDDPASMMLEQITGKFLAGTPYAYPVIGSTESLKNPKLSEMEAFYKKYYVASNMGLVLSGDIDIDALRPLLERTFGRLERGVKPVRDKIVASDIQGVVEDKFLFPMPLIKMSLMLFRAPANYDPDVTALKVALKLLNNDNNTGLLDELTNKNRVYMSSAEHIGLNQTGAAMLIVVPKLFCKAKTAENLTLSQVEKLINGEFSDEQLMAVKQMLQREAEMNLETITKRSELMVEAMSAGLSWDDYVKMQSGIKDITRDEVMSVARKYFTGNYMLLHKKNGKCPVEKIAKPEFTPVAPKHSGDKSAFAERLEQIPVNNNAPKLMDFAHDVTTVTLKGGNQLCVSENPVNDIFSLLINFHKGSKHDRLLEAAPDYVSALGTDSLDIKAFGSAMQQLGANMEMSSDEQETFIMLTGEEKNLEATLTLLSHFLDHMKPDKEKLEDLKDAAGPSEKAFWQENSDVFMALMSKVMLGQQSSFLTRLTAKALKKVSADDLVTSFKRLYDCRCNVSYTGRKSPQEVASALSNLLPQISGTQDHALEEIALQVPQDRSVYIFDMPKSRQTLIGLYLPLSSVTSDRERTLLELWGEYFGGDMSSVLFQEVREFRSLAYASQGIVVTPKRVKSSDPSGFVAVVGTQGDKSMQAISLLDSLLSDMPINSENMRVAQQSLLNGVNNSYPSFRGKAILVPAQQRYGYTRDANTARVELLPSMTQADVESFYRQQVKDKPYQLMIVGNVKNLDLKMLSRYGTIVKVKKDDIYKTKEPKR